MTAQWWSEGGLFLDALAFAILSLDLVRSMHGERVARDEIQKLEKASFAARYGVWAPDQSTLDAQQREFDGHQAERKRKSEQDMALRARLAYFAIFLSVIGLGMQIYGGWPN